MHSHSASEEEQPFYPTLISTLVSDANLRPEVSIEYLDLVRFPGEPHQEQLSRILAQKYQAEQIDLLLATGFPALQFLTRHGQQLWPGKPIVFTAVDRTRAEPLPPGANITGVTMSIMQHSAAELPLKLQPDLEKLIVLSGSNEFDRFWAEKDRASIVAAAPALNVTNVFDLAPPALQVFLQQLGPRTAVFCRYYSQDRTGRTYTRPAALKAIVESSKAPVYSAFRADLGSGVVGGYVITFDEIGREAATMALQILKGMPLSKVPVRHWSGAQFMVDWRQLRRWRMSAGNLPDHTVVMFRPVSVWQTHRLELGIVALLLVSQSVVIAMLLLHRRRRRQAEAAVRNLSGRLLHAQESERRRIAGELHDDVGQQIAALGLSISMVKRNLTPASPEASDRLNKTLSSLNSLAESVRTVSHQLHPAALENCGLEEALRAHTSRFSALTGIEVTFSAKCETAISAEIALSLFRICQEGLQNVVKHAQASEMSVVLMADVSHVRLTIADNGKGFDRESVRTSSGLGLVSMDERMRFVGGSVRLIPGAASGTILTAIVPLTRAKTLSESGSHQAAVAVD